jgi:O-antigen/teichoic acid export membrane protein
MMQALNKLKTFLPKNSFVRSVLVLAGGTALGQLITLLASPFITRLYTAEDFGLLAVFTSLLGIFLVVASWRYEFAVPLPEDDKDAAALLVLSLVIVMVMSLVTLAVVLLFPDALANLLGSPQLAPYLWLLPLSLVAAGTYQVISYWSIRQKHFKQLSVTKLTQSLWLVAVQLGLGFLGLRPLGLFVGDLVGRFGGSGSLARLAWKQSKDTFKLVRVADLRSVAYRYRKFPLLSSGSSLLNAAGLQLPAILFASLFGPQIAGWFALSQRLVAIPSVLIGRSVLQVYMNEAARLANTDAAGLKKLFLQTTTKLLQISIAPCLLMVAFGGLAFSLVFGKEWFEAGRYLQVLSIMFLAQFVTFPISQTLIILEKQGWQLAWDTLRFVLVVVSIAVPYAMGVNPFWSVVSYSAAMLVAYVVLFQLSLFAVNKRISV